MLLSVEYSLPSTLHSPPANAQQVCCFSGAQIGCVDPNPQFGMVDAIRDCCILVQEAMWYDRGSPEARRPCVGTLLERNVKYM